jgi:hypothetical protein
MLPSVCEICITCSWNAVMHMLVRPEKVHVVCRYQPHPEFAAEAFCFAQYAPISGREVLHLDVQAVGEDFF